MTIAGPDKRIYVFLCGVTWCKFGQEDAAREILRAPDSNDLDVSSLASAMSSMGRSTRGRSLDSEKRLRIA
jgi:hypothetical protein